MSVVANVAINVDSRGATQKLREVQSQATATERAIGGLGGAIGKLAAAFTAAQAIRFVFVQAAEIQSQTRSLEVLTGSVQKATEIVKQLQDLGAATPFTSIELIDAAKRLQAFGVETEKVVDTTRRLADVSGATGAELQGLVTAYGQVQAKGRLQGEELLQFQERGVALQKILKDEYKLSGEAFQDALEKGRISAEAVEIAILKLTDAGGKYANGAIAQSDTLNGKLSTLQDSFQRLAQNIGTFFEPVFKFLLDGVNAILERLNNAQRIGAETRAYEEANRRTRTRFGALRYANPFDQEVRQYQERLRKSLVASEMGGMATAAPTISAGGALPALLAPSGGKSKTGKSDAERAAEKLRKELERSLEVGDQLGTEFSRQVVLLTEADEIEKKRLQIQFDYEDRAKQINELKNAEQKTNLTDLNNEIKRLETLQLQTEELKKQVDEYYKRAGLVATESLAAGSGAFTTAIDLDPNNEAIKKADELKLQLEELMDPINMAMAGAQGIGDAFSSAFKGIIDGTQSTQEVLSNFFKDVGDAFVDMATEIIAQMVVMYAFQQLLGIFGASSGSLFSGQGPVTLPAAGVGGGSSMFTSSAPSFFAEGGFVTGPTSAVIGEAGEPEYVIPASKMRSAMGRYASGARGSSVIPGGSEIANEQGGGTAVATPIDVRYSVERINSVDYVTADQFQAGMQQAAAQGAIQGEQLAMRKLQQSASTRNRLGLK